MPQASTRERLFTKYHCQYTSLDKATLFHVTGTETLAYTVIPHYIALRFHGFSTSQDTGFNPTDVTFIKAMGKLLTP